MYQESNSPTWSEAGSESGSETNSTCKAQEIYDSIQINTTNEILEKINKILHGKFPRRGCPEDTCIAGDPPPDPPTDPCFCRKFPQLSLEFNTYEEMTKGKEISDFDIYDKSKKPALLLCLLENGKCISSISCKINAEDNAIEISSKTNEEHQGKKYNIFLRYAIVLIITHLIYDDDKHFEKIISRAVNPISIYSMIAHFEATTSNKKLIEYTNTLHDAEGNPLNLKNLTKEQVKEFYDRLREIPEGLGDDNDDIMEYCEREIEPYDPVIMEINIPDDPPDDPDNRYFIGRYMDRIFRLINYTAFGAAGITVGGKKTKRRKTKKGKKTRRRRRKK